MEKQSTTIDVNGDDASTQGRRAGGGGGDVDMANGHETTFRQDNNNMPKRRRRSTGGTYSAPLSTNEFKSLPTDDKLVTLFEMLNCSNKLSARVNNVETKVSALSEDNISMNKRMKTLEYRSIDAEARSRRNNLLFRGIPEVYLVENCEALVRQFLRNELDIDTSSMYIQRAHRLGKFQNDTIRPIIVCFRDYPDVETILKNAPKLKGKPNYGINRDYPSEIVAARSRIWSEFKEERRKNPPKTVFIGFPAKLVVNKKVIRDEFPDWRPVLDGPRHAKGAKDGTNVTDTSKTNYPRQDPLSTSNRFEALMESQSETDTPSDSDDTSGIDHYSQSMLNLEADARLQPRARYVSSQEVTLTNAPAENGAVDLSVSNTG